MKNSALKNHIFFHLFFIALLFVFYPSLFLAKAAPLTGDHWEQHYPWASLLSQSLKQWKLPFWTSRIHCGFPIAAESQIAIFYLPHLILYFFLPFKWAYSWMNLIHFWFAGWGTYLYCRKMKLSQAGSILSSVIFVFGAAFGGAYYNMTSLKTIAWFPLGLYLFERIYQERSWKAALGLGISIALSFVAGYLQMAAYTWLIFLFYVFNRITWIRDPDIPLPKVFLQLALSMVIAGVLMFPQIYLTYQLSLQSNRLGLTEDYAYIGSLSPLAWVSFFIPTAQYIFRGNNLYCGLFTLLLIITSLVNPAKESSKLRRLWVTLTILAALLALGRWSPLYAALIKVTHFYSFRFPAKFLGFICFGFSILAGIGLEKILLRLAEGKNSFQAEAKVYFFSFLGFFAVALSFWLLLRWGGDHLAEWGNWYIRTFIYGKAGHEHSLNDYLARIPEQLQSFAHLYNPHDRENQVTLALLFFGFLSSWYFYRKPYWSKRLLVFGFLFLFGDLYSFAWIDVKQDFSTYQKAYLVFNSVTQRLIRENKEGKVGKLYSYRKLFEALPVIPSSNILLDISEIGAYSPLVMKRYYNSIGLLGDVNDSNIATSPDPAFVYAHLSLLNALDVTHILSTQALDNPSLILLDKNELHKNYLYQLNLPSQKAFLVNHVTLVQSWDELQKKLMAPGFTPKTELLLEESESKLIPFQIQNDIAQGTIEVVKENDENSTWMVKTSGPVFFVRPEMMYPGWKAKINGAEIRLYTAYGLFQSIFLPKAGQYQIQFSYHPFESLLNWEKARA
ncbi:MAG: hypothetical protein EXS63_01225 [Candidatus Omnitrophica bacterium]|nr:hypothetical protein [Candidatus Omnitrophota bacterium]